MGEIFYCDNCGTALQDRACKLVCPKCHFFYSCSDYIYPPEPPAPPALPAKTAAHPTGRPKKNCKRSAVSVQRSAE